MTPENISKTHKKKAQEITFLRMVVGAALLIALTEAVIMVKTIGTERTIVMPPNIEKSFWVSSEGVSKSYLEKMAYFYTGLALSSTKSVGEYQKTMFLQYASPDKRGKLTAEMNARLEFMEKNATSTLFSPDGVKPDEKLMRVAVFGTLETYVQDRRISAQKVIYVVAFKNVNGTLFVNEFKETNEKDMFGVSTPAK
ncbi:MAG: TraE/TraK family type IV conjugative transfer system protein [Gallionella sp.]